MQALEIIKNKRRPLSAMFGAGGAPSARWTSIDDKKMARAAGPDDPPDAKLDYPPGAEPNLPPGAESSGPPDASAIVGYLNFSDGTPNPIFQRSVSAWYRYAATQGDEAPWLSFRRFVETSMERNGDQSKAFQDCTQARSVLSVVYDSVWPRYRTFHRDLLQHATDADLVQPFFLAKLFEAVLVQHGPWDEGVRIASAALEQLNDFVGYRPIVVFKSGQTYGVYPHERVRPIPIYLRGAGFASGKHEALISKSVEILRGCDPSTLAAASLDLDLIDELALDPRAYDHNHPVSQRAGYQFGEWDPYRLDNKGRYRRFVLRSTILGALHEWLEQTRDVPAEEALVEAAAALAGTMLLASGISGGSPQAFDSETTLGTLVPRIAQCRDEFYRRLLEQLSGPIADRLRRDAEKTRQPFGSIRQYLNRCLAAERAAQLQHDVLAQIEARMGAADAARRLAYSIPTPSTRLRCELRIAITAAASLASRGEIDEAATQLRKARRALFRAIRCGGIVDPWYVLGFGGDYPLFPSPDGAVHDVRVDQLLEMVQSMFDAHVRLIRETASRGAIAKTQAFGERLLRLADWWDAYATSEIADVQRVSGGEAHQTAMFVARALARWRESRVASGNVSFWTQYADEFSSPQSYCLVIDALLANQDAVASMALLMHWLSRSDDVPLEDENNSFGDSAFRWVQLVVREATKAKDGAAEPVIADPTALLIKFFDHLEVNAEDWWQAPTIAEGDMLLESDVGDDDDWELAGGEPDEGEEVKARPDENDDEDLFAAAYEGVTFRDSTSDGNEGETLDSGGVSDEELLPVETDWLLDRVDFQSLLASLWQEAAAAPWDSSRPQNVEALATWFAQASTRKHALKRLIDEIAAIKIDPPNTGSQESVIEFDRRQSAKFDLLSDVIDSMVEMCHAAFDLAAAISQISERPLEPLASWERQAITLLKTLRSGTTDEIRNQLAACLKALKQIPLLYVPLEHNGDPHAAWRSKHVREFLRRLVIELPRYGLFRETYHVLEAALDLERTQPVGAQQVTEFNLLFQSGYGACLECLVDQLVVWPETSRDINQATTVVGAMVGRFSRLWIDHLGGVRLSELERCDKNRWDGAIRFIKRYGRDLFTQKFMTFSNLRGILQQGVAEFLNRLFESEEEPPLLIRELGSKIKRDEAVRHIELVLRAIMEKYDAYRDYNTTTTQSDYGENLYMLLELLQVLAGYERHRWALQPAYTAHSALCRRGLTDAANQLKDAFLTETLEIADKFVADLEQAERKFGLRIATINDRIGERLVKPLQLDRLLALVEPAIRAAERAGSAGKPTPFSLFQQELDAFSQTATGAGLDVPAWLRSLESEVDRVLDDRDDEETVSTFPGAGKPRPLTFERFQEQFSHWDDPFLPEGGGKS